MAVELQGAAWPCDSHSRRAGHSPGGWRSTASRWVPEPTAADSLCGRRPAGLQPPGRGLPLPDSAWATSLQQGLAWTFGGAPLTAPRPARPHFPRLPLPLDSYIRSQILPIPLGVLHTAGHVNPLAPGPLRPQPTCHWLSTPGNLRSFPLAARASAAEMDICP